ncbi:Di-copper centre-containing protein [Wilcoxina mikolae CBS 423.85]|nr:Di-copper centre-containing protein [Wilcoxina mikolae CBS 423.85]
MKPIIRKEWRQLSIKERKKFTAAVVCLTKLPSKAPAGESPGARHRYDDFNSVHIIMANGLNTATGGVHLVGFFWQWHRYFIHLFEKALRNECGWEGGLPYWDWSIDASSLVPLEDWPIYNAKHGFGGNGPYVAIQPVTYSWPYMAGQTGGGCVKDGPFKNVTINVGPGQSLAYKPHCLHRGLNPTTIPFLQPSAVAYALESEDYLTWDSRAQAPPDITPARGITTFHGSGHYIQGGDSTDYISSTSEPIFWLHHAYLDKLYWQWQSKNLTGRLSEVGGPTIPFHPASGPVTLEQPLNVHWEGDTIPLKKVMDIKGNAHGGFLCYDYQ